MKRLLRRLLRTDDHSPSSSDWHEVLCIDCGQKIGYIPPEYGMQRWRCARCSADKQPQYVGERPHG